LSENGEMVTPDGYKMAAGISIPDNAMAITIGQDGIVSVRTPGSTTPSQVGQIQGARFPNNAGLRAIGRNLYEETESSGSPITGTFGENGFGRLNQGFLETSNVSVCRLRFHRAVEPVQSHHPRSLHQVDFRSKIDPPERKAFGQPRS